MNEVEITITSKDKSTKGFDTARTRAKAFATEITGLLAKAGGEAGKAMGDEVVAEAERAMQQGRARLGRGGQDLGEAISGGVQRGTEPGQRAVEGFTSSALASFGRLGPGVQLAVGAGVVGAFALAGTAAGGFALAAGGALTTVGMVAAAQSMRVKREWSDTWQEIKSGSADVAAPMERSAIKAAGVVRSTFGRLKPFLSSFFRDSEPAVDRFVKSIGDGVTSLGPALQPVQRGYSAVLDAISARNPEIFGSLERSLSNLGRTAEEHADDIASAFEFVAGAVETTTEVVDSLADSWSRFTDDVAAAGDAGHDFGTGLREGLYDLYRTLGINTDQMKRVEEGWAAVDAAAANNGGVQGASSAASDLGGAAGDAAAGLRDLAAEMERLNGPALDAAEAQIRVEESIDRATESIRENGRTLDVNTEKGRANRGALVDMARAAQDHIAAMQAEGASTDAITSKYGAYRGQLVAAARQAGLTKGQAERLAEAWLAVPDQVVTHARGNMSDLESKIAAAKARLRDPGLTRPERAQIRAEISDLQRKVAQAKSALASVHGKRATTFIDTIYRYSSTPRVGVGTVLAPQKEAHGGIIGGLGGVKRFATGGVAGAGSSLAMVGEQGPELVRLPVGSSVTGAGQTRAMLGGGGGGGFGSISMAFRKGGGDSTGGLAGSMRDLTKALRDVISLRDGMSRFTDSMFGQSRALIAYEAAWDAVKKSLKDNGKTLNITTTKGRENREALLSLADAAHSVVFAMHDMGKPMTTIVAKMKEQRAEFIKAARSFGLSAAQAKKVADAYGLVPSKVKSVITKEKTDLAYNKAAEKYNATLNGKAGGGPAGGWTMVGERGAELVRLPYGSQVTAAGQTAAMMAGGGGPARVVLEVHGGRSDFDRFMAQWIRKYVRVEGGGNVQAAFGRA